MIPENVRTPADARELVGLRKLDKVKVGVFDIDGTLHSRNIGREKFFSALDKGFGFRDVVRGANSNEQIHALSNASVRMLPETCRIVPLDKDVLMFLGEFCGDAEEICPRAMLRRVLRRAGAMGYEAVVGTEFEFLMFKETPRTSREKGLRDMTGMTPGSFGYSILRSTVHAEFHHQLLELCAAMRMPLEGLHTESGPGMLEAAIQYCEALEAADRATLFKTFTKILAMRNGMIATFMAKVSMSWQGQSGHIHTSLRRQSDLKPVFHDSDKPNNMSDEMRWYVGGQQRLMPELLCMVARTVNSYSRLVPGFWAPTSATWGVDNRTTALRVIPGEPDSQRVEYRITAADINPYLAIAVAIGSGLHGIENRLEPDPMVNGNAYCQYVSTERSLPRTLGEAAERFVKSQVGRDLFGSTFVEYFAASREREEREFRYSITDWELKRYFELI